MNNYTNNEPYNLRGFNEQIKIKYETAEAIAGKFSNGTAALMELLTNAQPPLDWAVYRALTADQQLVWEVRADELNQAMLLLMNLKIKWRKNGKAKIPSPCRWIRMISASNLCQDATHLKSPSKTVNTFLSLCDWVSCWGMFSMYLLCLENNASKYIY